MRMPASLFLPSLLLLGVSVPHHVAAQQSLLSGRFTTTGDVQDILNLSLDVRDMKIAPDQIVKLNIYSNVRCLFREAGFGTQHD